MNAPRTRCAPLLLLLAATGCVATATPTLSPDMVAALQARPMRRLETSRTIIYYPDGARPAAERMAGRLEACHDALMARARIHNEFSRQKPVVVMPHMPLNNAFMSPPVAGSEPLAVVPTYNTIDFLMELGQPPDASGISCHEIAHYVHQLQVAGFWRWINFAFGNIVSPQLGLDPWFDEGLATYYESLLQPGTGRVASPLWDGYFHAGVAGRHLNGGDLSPANRSFPFGSHYLVGSRFIEFLVARYGEERLWKFIELQGRSIFFPLGVNPRFWQAYDKSLSTLIDEFDADVTARYPVVTRPPEQRKVRDLGTTAHYAVGRDGTEAVIGGSMDAPLRLEIFAPDGRQLRNRDLHDILFPRQILQSSTPYTSGLSVTADGRTVIFTIVDQGPTFSRAQLCRYDVAEDRLTIIRGDLGGAGGGADDGGRFFVFARAEGDHHALAEIDLASGQTRTIVEAPPRVYFSGARPSPDGTRIVTSLFAGNRTTLVVFDRASGRQLATVPATGQTNLDPWWVDNQHVVFAGEHRRQLQIYSHDLATRVTTLISQAPYLATSPRPVRGRVRFLNRQGWSWTVDEVAAPAATLAPAVIEAETFPEPVDAPVQVESDTAYHSWERLFVPQLWAVNVFGPLATTEILEATVAGGDRLGAHRWALRGGAELHTGEPLYSVAYTNQQLAPFVISVAAGRLRWQEDMKTTNGTPEVKIQREQRSAALTLSRGFYTHGAYLGFLAVDDRKDALQRRIAGPEAGFTLSAHEATPYAGVRRMLELSTRAAFYPKAFTNFGDQFSDGRAELAAAVPLPPFTRPTLRLNVVARGLAGLPRHSNLLQLGGLSDGKVYLHSDGPERAKIKAPEALPDLIALSEPLAGYEDYGVGVDHVLIGQARLRIPLIVDRGWASSLGILPSFFLRQFTLGPFAAAAWDLDGRRRENLHAAAGGRLSADVAFGGLPLSIGYQLAKRLVDDRALVNFVSLGVGL